MTDTYRHQGLRRKLTEEIRQKGIRDPRILEAIGSIQRHLFLDSSFVEFAYQDKPFPIGSGQTISQPYTVAFMTELLEVQKGHKILEVGTGSGYQACVLLALGAKVYTIERQRQLYLKTKAFLPEIGYRPQFFYGDGYKGLPSFQPFDGIIVTAGAPEIPDALQKQLKIGGRLVIPVGAGTQTMIRMIRVSETEFKTEHHGAFRFVPLLKDRANDL
ncbi:MAG: protein-L-isoaspartate(D-aspartate) O-methyltransferase [Bacteroidales bacterium]